MNAKTQSISIPFLAFGLEEANAAYAKWGANCGPTALAAALGLTLDAVRPHLGDFEAKGYLNTPMMRRALASLGATVRDMEKRPPRGGMCALPRRGLVRIQWSGPWLQPGVHPGAAASRTHWVAAIEHDGVAWIFDVNGGWLAATVWEDLIVPAITETIKRADGGWLPTHRWEVSRRLRASKKWPA